MPRNVILAAYFPATPEQLFDIYLDLQCTQHSRWPVFIGNIRTSFQAFDGMLSGTILHVEPSALSFKLGDQGIGPWKRSTQFSRYRSGHRRTDRVLSLCM